MSIALVSAGSVAFTSSGTSLTPSFGQATTAGNLLIARVSCSAGTTWPTTSASGWVKAISETGAGTIGCAIWYKPNCSASEAAPAFTASSGAIAADLTEWSGAATSSVVDKSGFGSSNTAITSFQVGNSSQDTNNSDVAIVVIGFTTSKSATCTFGDSWAPSGGSVQAAQGTGGSKAAFIQWGSAYLLNGNGFSGLGDSDTVSITLSTGTTAGLVGCGASFFPAAPPILPVPKPTIISYPAFRSSNY